MKRALFLVTVILFFLPALWGEDEKPVVKISPFAVQGVGSEEARIVESLIQSYIAALGDVVLEPQGTLYGSEAPSSPEGSVEPDYILSGSITLEQDSHILMLEVKKNRTGETAYYTSAHKSTGEMVLKARAMVASAFGGSESPRESEPELLTEGKIAGVWRGDTGIEVIRFQRGGRGTAIFSSGAQMHLSYTIENNTLKVVQNSPNTERFYHPVPYAVAKELRDKAEPMRWEMLLYEGGTALKGIKIATAVRYEDNRILELLPMTARSAEWTKTGR